MTRMNRIIAALMIMLSIGAIGASYQHGVERHLDTRITWGFEDDAWAMSVALSRLLFGLHEGYIGYREVVRITAEVLAPGGPHEEISKTLMSSRTAIQGALDAAQKIDRKTLPKYTHFNPDFVSIYYNDLGLSDFYTLSFLIFGYQADAMYRLYFLIMGLSLVAFAWEYRRQIEPLATLALVCGTFPVFLFSDLLNDIIVPSVNSNRFMSTLGFIPILHMAWTLRFRAKPDKGQILRIVFQGLIFAFAISIRKTAQIQLYWFLAVMGVVAWPIWRSQVKRFSLAAGKVLWNTPALRSGFLFIVVFLGYALVQMSQLNRIYFTDCALTHHVVWHSLAVGLSSHPDWEKYNTFAPRGLTGSDNLGWKTLERYTKEHGLELTCPQTNIYRIGLHERIMRELVLTFLVQHPWYALELYFYYNPRDMLAQIWKFSGVDPEFWWWAALLSIFVGACTGWVKAREHRALLYRVFPIGLLATALFCLPGIIFNLNRFMPDMMWMIVITPCLLIWLATAWLCQVILTRWVKSQP